MNRAESARALEGWFVREARGLPWRTTPRDPYRSLISEFMLQQTQVSRVLEKFGVFLERFPDVRTLAAAPEEDVLGVWSGLGYYSRARRLHAAARAIVDRFDGRVPSDVEDLVSLPGVGKYTAGAIASLVFGVRTPIVDGNVQRVLIRLHGEEFALGTPSTEKWAWSQASAHVESCASPALFNEGLMELGATVCTPKGPRCSACPLAPHCEAFASGRQEDVPLPKPRGKKKDAFHALALVVRDGRVLLTRRPAAGLWAGMWSPPSVEVEAKAPTHRALREAFGVRDLEEAGGFVHETTHRRVHIACYRVRGEFKGSWFGADEVERIAISNAHARVVKMALGTPDRP